MLRPRIIPSLLIRDDGLVKTRQFDNPKYVGDPINAIRIFNEKEVDELIVLDISAGRAGREPNYRSIAEFASECFMPLCYGGGITALDHAKRLLSLGVEKIAVQTGAIKDISLITQIAEHAGSSSVVVSIDLKRNWRGKSELFAAGLKKSLNENWIEFLIRSVDAGAGEILLNSVDRDGMISGMDLESIQLAARAVEVPVIASGGAGSLKDLRSAIDAGANAVAAGSLFVFQGPHRAVLITYPSYDELTGMMA